MICPESRFAVSDQHQNAKRYLETVKIIHRRASGGKSCLIS